MRKHFPYLVLASEAKDPTRFFNVPVGLLEIVLKEKFFAPFELLMYFKTESKSGQMRITTEAINKAAADLNVTPRTVRNNLKRLLKRNWIGRFRSGGYILRGFDKLRRMEKEWTRTAVIFDRNLHLKKFREFVIAACIGRLVSRQRARLWRERLSGERKGTPNVRKQPLPTLFPIAGEAMAQIYGISVGTAFNWKNAAHKVGFITVEKILRPVHPEWMRAFPDEAHRVIQRDGRYFLQYPDKVKCNLKFCRRRSLTAYGKNLNHPERHRAGAGG